MAPVVLNTRNGPARVERKACTPASFNNTSGPNPNPRHKFLSTQPRNPHFSLPVQNPAPTDPKQSSGSNGVPYITFRTGSCTKPQLMELKRRLVSELQLVRSLRTRLDSLAPVHPPQTMTEEKKQKKRGRKPGFKIAKTRRRNPNPYPDKASTLMMKQCGMILAKIMKQKSARVFNKPVDVAGMKLLDYHYVIKNPMDLGTIKSNLANGVYSSPISFAADVRLTFSNAMSYNPKDHAVHWMAVELLSVFNSMFNPAYQKYEEEQRGRKGGSGHQVRKMTYEERAQLGRELEGLPQEVVGELMEIVGRRNGNVAKRDGDEIEIDFEIMDDETLWELHQFIGKCKRMMSNGKQQLVNNRSVALAGGGGAGDKAEIGQTIGGGEEEVVDIGEEAPVGTYPPLVIEKDASDTSYTSRASSSRGSDSGSSSDTEIAKSPYVEAHKT